MVSFVLPAYKDKFLRFAIESILQQTYKDFELIIVNDKSPYNLKEIVASYQSPRIRYYENSSNIGGKDLVANWNQCLKYAQGDFIVLASDDDYYLPTYLEKMISLSERYPQINLFHCRVAIIDDNNKFIYWGSPIAEYESDIDFIFQRAINRRTQLAPEFMCRTSALKELGGFINYPRAWYSDEMTWYALAKGNGVAATNETLFYWRSSQINISTSTNDIIDKVKASEKHFRGMKDLLGSLIATNDRDQYLLNYLDMNIRKAIVKQLIYDLAKTNLIQMIKVLRQKSNRELFDKRDYINLIAQKMKMTIMSK